MKRYSNVSQNQYGDGLSGITISVYLTGTATLATLYSDEGVTSLANPFTSSAYGRYGFYAADGVYDITYSGTGVISWTDEAVEVRDYVDSDVESGKTLKAETITATGAITSATLTTSGNISCGQNLIALNSVISQSGEFDALYVTGNATITGTLRFDVAITAKTAAYTATISDTVILCDATGGAFSVTLPEVLGGANGRVLHIKKTDASANAVTVDGHGAETIDGAATQALSAQYDSIMIVSDGTEWWIL